MGLKKTNNIMEAEIRDLREELAAGVTTLEASQAELVVVQKALDDLSAEYEQGKVSAVAVLKEATDARDVAVAAAEESKTESDKAKTALVGSQTELSAAKGKLSGPEFNAANTDGLDLEKAPDVDGEGGEDAVSHYDEYCKLKDSGDRAGATAYFREHSAELQKEIKAEASKQRS